MTTTKTVKTTISQQEIHKAILKFSDRFFCAESFNMFELEIKEYKVGKTWAAVRYTEKWNDKVSHNIVVFLKGESRKIQRATQYDASARYDEIVEKMEKSPKTAWKTIS